MKETTAHLARTNFSFALVTKNTLAKRTGENPKGRYFTHRGELAVLEQVTILIIYSKSSTGNYKCSFCETL